MDIKLKYREVFKNLYDTEKGLLAFTLYRRYNIKPSEAIYFIELYEKKGIITVDEEQRIKLTIKGRELINVILNTLNSKKPQDKSYISSWELKESIELFEPYLPENNFYKYYITERSKKETSI